MNKHLIYDFFSIYSKFYHPKLENKEIYDLWNRQNLVLQVSLKAKIVGVQAPSDFSQNERSSSLSLSLLTIGEHVHIVILQHRKAIKRW